MVQATISLDELTLESAVVSLYKAARCAQVLTTDDVLDPAMGRVLISVVRLGPARPSVIAQENHIDLSTASRHIDALLRQGLVLKSVDPGDARASLVEVSPEGRDVMKAMVANRTRAIEPALVGWSKRDRKQLVSLLVRLAHDLDRLIQQEVGR